MNQPFMGVQVGSHSVFDEGVDHVLDVLQSTAQINALVVYTHSYSKLIQNRPIEGMADHGKGTWDPQKRNLTHMWVSAREEHYCSTFLRHKRTAEEEYADRDVVQELVGSAHSRRMGVYGRILEGSSQWLASYLPNWSKILTIDVYGRRATLPCWNNPAYRSWLISTVDDLFCNYELDGFKYGAERSGPLTNLLVFGQVPGCFCEHCRAAGEDQNIDVERALVGFRTLYEFVQSALVGDRPSDGYFVAFLRILLKYPEILSWEYAWHHSKESVAREMYGTIKAIKPDARVGWHVYHPVTWDPVYQAMMDYAEMVPYSDWIKPVVYHDIAGVRIRDKYLMPLSRTIFRDVDPESLRSGLFQILGYDPSNEPNLDDLPTSGMSPDYAQRQVRRCVEAVNGQIPVYAGVGFDVPTDGNPIRSTPERVYRAAYGAFEAGASGLLVSREYDEMRLENLEAVGRAVNDARDAGIVEVS